MQESSTCVREGVHSSHVHTGERAAAGSSSSTTARAGARAYTRTRESEQQQAARIERDVDDLARYYCQALGAQRCPPMAMREMEGALLDGMDVAVIYRALDEASMAPRPSWAYARAILNRCFAEGALTLDAYELRQSLFYARCSRNRDRREDL